MAMNKQKSFALTEWVLLWGSRMAVHPYVDGHDAVEFSSLLPDGKKFVELFNDQETGLATGRFELVQLLAASKTFGPMKALLAEGLLSWEQRYPGNVTLAHIMCAFDCKEVIQLMQSTPPHTNVRSLKDSEGRDPLDVCFSSTLHNMIKASKWFKSSHQFFFGVKKYEQPPTKKPLSADIRSTAFRMASVPEDLYSLVILLQEYSFDVNKEQNEEGDLLIHTTIRGGLACLPTLFVLVKQLKANPQLANKKGMTPLCLAVDLGEEKLCEVLICVFRTRVNNPCSVSGRSPLHFAAQNNRDDIARILVNRGANPSQEDLYGYNPASRAQWYQSDDCYITIRQYIQQRVVDLSLQAEKGTLDVEQLFPSDHLQVSDKGLTLLMNAVVGDNQATVRALVSSKDCDVNFRQMKVPEFTGGSLYTEQQGQMTALSFAAKKGRVECTKILLDAGADPSISDSESHLPLHHACLGGHKECAKLILEYPDLRGLRGLHKALRCVRHTQEQQSIVHLLHEAIRKRQHRVVFPQLSKAVEDGDCGLLNHLIEEGDDVNPSDEYGKWPLFRAAELGHLELVKRLTELNGDVVRTNPHNGCSPLHVAAREGKTDVVRFLCQFCNSMGAEYSQDYSNTYLDINGRNTEGATALELASSIGHMAVVKVLLHHHAASGLPDSMKRLHYSPFAGVQCVFESRIKSLSRAIHQKNALRHLRLIWHGPSDFNLRDHHGDNLLMVVARLPKKDVRDVVHFLLQQAAIYRPDMEITVFMKTAFPVDPGNGYDSDYASDVPRQEERYARDNVENLLRPSSMPGASVLDHISPNTHEDNDSSRQLHKCAPANTGQCTRSGVVRLTNIRDGCTALHRAVQSEQYLVIFMLITADPLVKDIQNREGQTALHIACLLENKKCITVLLNCQADATICNNQNQLAEDLVDNPRLKKKVMKQRCQQTSEMTGVGMKSRSGQSVMKNNSPSKSLLEESCTPFPRQSIMKNNSPSKSSLEESRTPSSSSLDMIVAEKRRLFEFDQF